MTGRDKMYDLLCMVRLPVLLLSASGWTTIVVERDFPNFSWEYHRLSAGCCSVGFTFVLVANVYMYPLCCKI